MSRGHHKWKLLIVIGEVVVTTTGSFYPPITIGQNVIICGCYFFCVFCLFLKLQPCSFLILRLACRCSARAKEAGYPFFALRFWGICLGVQNLNSFRASSTECSTGNLKPCSAHQTEECVGKGNADFIYRLGMYLYITLCINLFVR